MPLDLGLCTLWGIPEHLHRQGREVDPFFDDEEDLYRRFQVPGTEEELKKEGIRAAVKIFDLKRDSYVRSKYCESPEDVLFNAGPTDPGDHFHNDGIVSIKVGHLRADKSTFMIRENGKQRHFAFSVFHDPQECIYPHTEVIVMENGEIAPKRPNSVKLIFREMLMDFLQLRKPYNNQ